MAILRYRLREQNRGEGGDEEGVDSRRSPADVNREGNDRRLSRMEEISRVADGRRAEQLSDVDGERVSGRFQNGEFDDSAEAREQRARAEEDAAEQALDEERRREAGDDDERAEARRLQEEGGEGAAAARGDDAQAGDERVVNGVRYYLTIVNGAEKWLTVKQLREHAATAGNVEEALQRAQEALRSAAQPGSTPKETPDEIDDVDLENVILSASMGDEEAVKKLARAIKDTRAGKAAPDVRGLVAQQIATQREVDRAESTQADLLGNDILAPIFRQRLREFGQAKPQTRIVDAYKAVGDDMRKDFAAMVKTPSGGGPAASKADRKRSIVSPPAGAGRQPRRDEDDREVPVGEQIDAIAKSRGQQRAIRQRRS